MRRFTQDQQKEVAAVCLWEKSSCARDHGQIGLLHNLRPVPLKTSSARGNARIGPGHVLLDAGPESASAFPHLKLIQVLFIATLLIPHSGGYCPSRHALIGDPPWDS